MGLGRERLCCALASHYKCKFTLPLSEVPVVVCVPARCVAGRRWPLGRAIIIRVAGSQRRTSAAPSKLALLAALPAMNGAHCPHCSYSFVDCLSPSSSPGRKRARESELSERKREKFYYFRFISLRPSLFSFCLVAAPSRGALDINSRVRPRVEPDSRDADDAGGGGGQIIY